MLQTEEIPASQVKLPEPYCVAACATPLPHNATADATARFVR